MTSSPLLNAALIGAGYLSSLVLLFGWFVRSETSHVLPLGKSAASIVSRCRWRTAVELILVSVFAAGLLAVETGAFARTGKFLVPAFSCPNDWLPTSECSLDFASGIRGRSTAFIILMACATILLAIRRFALSSAYYPLALLLLAMMGFGATADLVSGGRNAAPPQLVFRIVAAMQFAAAFAFALGVFILRPKTIAEFMRCMLVHLAGACVRILGAFATLAIWPHLPPASAITLLFAALLVPGVATALAGAAALSANPQIEC